MRKKSHIQFSLKMNYPSSIKVVEEYREKYQKIDNILQIHPQLLDSLHQDWEQNLSSSTTGRSGKYSSEQLLRSLIVMFVEGLSYRETAIRIEDSDFLRDFVGLGWNSTMDYTFLSRAFGAVSPASWEAINHTLGIYARQEGKITGDKQRIDSTVVETNIHYPTDSSLLWDSARVLIRELERCRFALRECGMYHRFHLKKIKKLFTFIARNSKSTSKRTQRKVKSHYKALIEQVERMVSIGKTLLERWEEWSLPQLKKYLPRVEKVLHQAQQRILHGVILPAGEKIYSIFEDHSELIKRGKAGKDVEFGHKVLIAQSGEKFITHYQVLPEKQADTDLLPGALEAHEELFGTPPKVLAADKGFYKNSTQLQELGQEIETVSIAKKGRRTTEEEQREESEEFRNGQKFRAGVEGSISVLKRAFKQSRCLFRGFKNYAASVGCAVFCHNLVLLSRL